jgi:hypothetical protein
MALALGTRSPHVSRRTAHHGRQPAQRPSPCRPRHSSVWRSRATRRRPGRRRRSIRWSSVRGLVNRRSGKRGRHRHVQRSCGRIGPAGPVAMADRRTYGAVGLTGSATFYPGTNTSVVARAGADIWGTADAFRFVYQPLAGDGQIVARVASVQNTNAWVKAGVTIRADLTPGSPQAMMMVTPGKNNNFQRRPAARRVSTSTAWGSGEGAMLGEAHTKRHDRHRVRVRQRPHVVDRWNGDDRPPGRCSGRSRGLEPLGQFCGDGDIRSGGGGSPVGRPPSCSCPNRCEREGHERPRPT